MKAQLLKKEDIAERMSMGWKRAQRLLAKMGVMPIDVGEGKYKRLRWLESSVDAAIVALHEQAQPKKKRQGSTRSATPGLKISLADMKASDVYQLVAHKPAIQ